MKLKFFRCRCCGERVEWNATSCPVCNRLVSNDRIKKNIVIGTTAGAVVMLLVVVLLIYAFQ